MSDMLDFYLSAKLCSEVKVIEYGEANSLDNWYLSEVNFSCIDGFHFPDGSTYRLVSCTKYGTWTADVPDCTSKYMDMYITHNNIMSRLPLCCYSCPLITTMKCV